MGARLMANDNRSPASLPPFLATGLMSAVAAIALAGCTVPRGELPEMSSAQPIPERWALVEPSGDAIALDRYWAMLDDPLVEEFVARAQQSNLDLAQAVTRLRTARAGLRQARAERVPRITANGGANRDVGDFARDDVQFSLGADASWEPDLFGRIDASVDAARGDLQAAGYSLGDLERSIVAQVASQVQALRAMASMCAHQR
jgi:outer membrane protein TolC